MQTSGESRMPRIALFLFCCYVLPMLVHPQGKAVKAKSEVSRIGVACSLIITDYIKFAAWWRKYHIYRVLAREEIL